jgi:predicted lactoylglutathione lyase
MRTRELDNTQKAVVTDQVRRMLVQSQSFRNLSAAQRADIERDTVAVATAIAAQSATSGTAPRRRGAPPRRRMAGAPAS